MSKRCEGMKFPRLSIVWDELASARRRYLPQLGNSFRDVALLKHADARYTSSPSFDALLGIAQIHASQRKRRHRRLRSASIATCHLEFADSGSLPVRFAEDRAEYAKVGSVCFG